MSETRVMFSSDGTIQGIVAEQLVVVTNSETLAVLAAGKVCPNNEDGDAFYVFSRGDVSLIADTAERIAKPGLPALVLQVIKQYVVPEPKGAWVIVAKGIGNGHAGVEL